MYTGHCGHNGKLGAIVTQNPMVKLNCNKVKGFPQCGLISGKTYTMSFKFRATKELAQKKILKYYFCAEIFGFCLSDFKPTPDICPILGCPLTEGKEYVVNILKKIPPLPFRMNSKAQISLRDEKSNVFGCVSFLVYLTN